MIVSASRRCDIPAHYMDWLMARIDAGYCLVRNPFDARSARRVPLAPPGLSCLVLWTRDARPIAVRARDLAERGLPYYAQVTLTGYPRALEPLSPGVEDALAGIKALADLIGAERLVWRFDPIFVAGGLSADDRRGEFERLASALEGRTRRVVVSLLDEYAGTRARLARAGFPGAVFGSARGGAREEARAEAGLFGPGREIGAEEPPEPYPALLADIAAIAASRGMEAVTCAEPYDLSRYGIGRAACVDRALITLAGGAAPPAGKDAGQRGACLCAPSVDIGAYGACPALCAYCYASRGRGRLLSPGAGDESLAPAPLPAVS